MVDQSSRLYLMPPSQSSLTTLPRINSLEVASSRTTGSFACPAQRSSSLPCTDDSDTLQKCYTMILQCVWRANRHWKLRDPQTISLGQDVRWGLWFERIRQSIGNGSFLDTPSVAARWDTKQHTLFLQIAHESLSISKPTTSTTPPARYATSHR